MSGFQEILIIALILLAILYLPRRTRDARSIRRIRPQKDLSPGIRMALVASLIWPMVSAWFLRPWEEDPIRFLYLGLVPVALGWAFWWVASGYRKKGR